RFPGCAARPWAVGCNAFGVKTEESDGCFLPRRGCIPQPRVAQRTLGDNRLGQSPGTIAWGTIVRGTIFSLTPSAPGGYVEQGRWGRRPRSITRGIATERRTLETDRHQRDG